MKTHHILFIVLSFAPFLSRPDPAYCQSKKDPKAYLKKTLTFTYDEGKVRNNVSFKEDQLIHVQSVHGDDGQAIYVWTKTINLKDLNPNRVKYKPLKKPDTHGWLILRTTNDEKSLIIESEDKQEGKDVTSTLKSEVTIPVPKRCGEQVKKAIIRMIKQCGGKGESEEARGVLT